MKFWLKILFCFIFMFFLSSDVEAVNFYTGVIDGDGSKENPYIASLKV